MEGLDDEPGGATQMITTKRTATTAVLAAVLGALAIPMAPSAGALASPTTYVVTALDDAVDADLGDGTCATAGGSCTLRAALGEAAAHPGQAARIEFAVAGDLRPSSAYPQVTSPTTIDASTAPGWAAGTRPTVRITCDDAPDDADGLVVTAPDTTIRALAIDGCTTALDLRTGADRARVLGSWIGVDGVPRVWPRNGLIGIRIASDDVVIGGPTLADGNRLDAQDEVVTASNPQAGAAVHHLTVQGNQIGVQPNPQVNGDAIYGVAVGRSIAATIGGPGPGEGNAIGEVAVGVNVVDDGSGVVVQGNRLGTDPTGTVAHTNNSGVGVNDSGFAPVGDAPVRIGGPGAGEGNLISASRFDAIRATAPVVVQGNRIGTDAAGTTALPNGDSQMLDQVILLLGSDSLPATGGAAGSLIGGSGPGEGNLISGNQTDAVIQIETSDITVLGNRLGTTADGAGALPNTGDTISVGLGSGNRIGGAASGEANLIAHSGRAGVRVEGDTGGSAHASIRGNVIIDSTYLPIDLDGHDPVRAGNGDQPPPTDITSTPAGGGLHVEGKVRSTGAGPLLVDVYAAATCGRVGTADAAEWLGAISVPHPGGGAEVAFAGDVAAPSVGSVISATSTRAGTDTSQLSTCAPTSDLRVTGRVNLATLDVGDHAAAELTVTNDGPAPIADLQLPFVVAAGPSAAADSVTVDPDHGTYDGARTWHVGPLAVGESARACVRGDIVRTFYRYDYYGIPKIAPAPFSGSIDAGGSGVVDPFRGDDLGYASIGPDGIGTSQPVVADLCAGPPLTVEPASLVRPTSGTAPMAFAVHLAEPAVGPVEVDYRTVKGTALPVDDFLATHGTLTIPAGETDATIEVPIVGGRTDEPDKAFTLEITDVRGATLADPADGSVTGTIEANHELAGCPAGSSTDRRFVCKLYADALRRSPDGGGIAYWVGRLASGTSRATVAASFLREPEALRTVADRPFVTYLGRHGTRAELDAWAARYRAGTATPQDTRLALLSGATYWSQAGSSATTFVQHLYLDVLRRPGDAGGVAYWSGRIAAGLHRGEVVRRFVAEPEGRRKIVGDLYLRFLRREPTAAEAQRWVDALAAGRTEVDVAIALTSSAAYAAPTG